jgi:streptomycin 6-kinase
MPDVKREGRRVDLPHLDEEVRGRLRRRYGCQIDAWFDGLPSVLSELAERWQIDWGTVIQRGSMSVVIRCGVARGRRAVLKVGPDRIRVQQEAAALASWRTAHVPAVIAVDESVGALLIEEVEPGTPLAESSDYPSLESLTQLLTSLHRDGVPDASFRPVAERVEYLFDSGTKPYERKPALTELISPELYEHGRRLALRLAADATASVLLHGDLTPVNVLDGGAERGLVAIDPAPCVGDPAFDAVDFVLWRAADAGAIEIRAAQLAPAIGADPARLLSWCVAFAAMVALEIAEAPAGSREQVEPLLALASRASTR